MRGGSVFFVLLLLISCGNGGAAFGQDIRARAEVDSTGYLIGDAITVRVELRHPRGIEFHAGMGDTLGGFHLLDRSPLTVADDSTTTARFVVAYYDSGTAILPPIPFAYRRSDDTTHGVVQTNPLVLTVSTVRVDTTEGIKDVKSPLSIPLTLAEVALYLGILVAIVAAAFFTYRHLKKRKEKKPEVKIVVPPKAAHIAALEALGMLREKKLWQQGLIKPYYSEVTEIIRRYFENRYGLMALEQTTDEILAGLQQYDAGESVIAECETMFRTADLVKFAKFQPGISEHENVLAGAYEVVEKTKLVEIPSAPVAEQEVANVGS